MIHNCCTKHSPKAKVSPNAPSVKNWCKYRWEHPMRHLFAFHKSMCCWVNTSRVESSMAFLVTSEVLRLAIKIALHIANMQRVGLLRRSTSPWLSLPTCSQPTDIKRSSLPNFGHGRSHFPSLRTSLPSSLSMTPRTGVVASKACAWSETILLIWQDETQYWMD